MYTFIIIVIAIVIIIIIIIIIINNNIIIIISCVYRFRWCNARSYVERALRALRC